MHGIAHGVGSEAAGHLGAEVFPVLDAVFGDDFHSSGDVALEELSGFSAVLLLDLHEARGSGGGEFSHAQLRDHKSVLVDGVEDLSSVHVDVGLNQGEGALLVCSKVGASKHISVINKLELSGEDSDHAAEEKFIHADVSARHSLEEHLAGLEVEHLNSLVLRVESEEVLADEASLLIEPLSLKNESLFGL